MARLSCLAALALVIAAGAAWGAGADDWKAIERERVLAQARPFLAEKPVRSPAANPRPQRTSKQSNRLSTYRK